MKGLKSVIIFVLAVAMSLCACGQPSEVGDVKYTPAELFARYSASAVEIRLGASAGSGFIAETTDEATYVASCFHVAGTELPLIKFYGESEYVPASDVQIACYDRKTDVIIYKVNRTVQAIGMLGGAISSARAGDEVYAIASPHGEGISIEPARLTLLEQVKIVSGYGKVLNRTDGGFYDGSSGGMLIDEFGRLAGVAVARNEEATGNDECYIAPAEIVAAVYAAAKAGKVTDGGGTTYKRELIRPDFSVNSRDVTSGGILRSVNEIAIERGGTTYRIEVTSGGAYLVGYEASGSVLTKLKDENARGSAVTSLSGVRTDGGLTALVAGLLECGSTDLIAAGGDFSVRF